MHQLKNKINHFFVDRNYADTAYTHKKNAAPQNATFFYSVSTIYQSMLELRMQARGAEHWSRPYWSALSIHS